MEEFKRVLILGANSDIAKNIAYQLSKKNYKLTLISRNIENTKSFLDSLKVNTDEIEFICMDLSETHNFQNYYESLENKHDIIISAIGELSSNSKNQKISLIKSNQVAITRIHKSKIFSIINLVSQHEVIFSDLLNN